MNESRLFRIVYTILEKGKVTAPQLAEKFEVSVRTIYRDIDMISSAGIPIFVTTGRNGGIQIQEDFVLEKAIFSDTEKQDILAAIQSLSVVENAIQSETLSKLSALLNTHFENYFEVDFARWGSKQQDNLKFELLKNAIIDHKAVQISYVGSYGKKNIRKIHPLKLFYKSKAWYVKAYCTLKNEFRLFKLNRITACELLNEDFVPIIYQEQASLDAALYDQIVLRFPSIMAYRVYDEFSEQEIEIEANGDYLVRSTLPIDGWLVGYLLSFGSQVEVIEPLHLKRSLCEEAKTIYENNKA